LVIGAETRVVVVAATVVVERGVRCDPPSARLNVAYTLRSAPTPKTAKTTKSRFRGLFTAGSLVPLEFELLA
jgi:hypothetical protein